MNDAHRISKKDPADVPARTEKANLLDTAMVGVGVLVAYIIKSASSAAVRAAAVLTKKILSFFSPLKHNILTGLKKHARSAGIKLINFAEAVINTGKTFKKRKTELGAFKALTLQVTDSFRRKKRNRIILRTAFNYIVPVVSVAVLISVVSETAAVNYGISVGFNGQEIGIVNEESVIDGAQKTISERATYYDTGALNSVAASFSIKPLGAEDEIIGEDALVDIIAGQIPEIESGNAPESGGDFLKQSDSSDQIMQTPDGEDKVRAFPVTVDGETIGAVSDFNRIEQFMNATKSRYLSEDVVSVEFDKEIEYGYEQYVTPDEIISQQDIINTLTAVVAEPVYYEVENGDTPWDLALDNDMTIDELKMCSVSYNGEIIPDITENCPVGAIIQLSAEVPFLQVMQTKEVVYNAKIDYETVKTEDANLYKGETQVDIKGVEGEKKVTALVKYKNDTVVSRKIIEEDVISEPVTQHSRVGTRATTTPVSTGNGGSGDYFWPVDGGYISAYRGDGRGHKGIDIAAPYGTPIFATANGYVTRAGNRGDGYGNCVRVAQDDSNDSLYAHMSSIAISNGDRVVEGQILGYVGSTGDSDGNHLHFEIISSNGEILNPIDYVTQY